MQENQQTVIVSPVQNPSFRESLSLWEKLSVLWQHKFLIIFFLFFNITASPTPALAESPAISPCKPIELYAKPCANITEEEQFGINPISDAISG